jgi:hypothetical protein
MVDRAAARRLLDAADGDGAALAWLRRQVVELTGTRRCPLHVGTLLTDVLTGSGPDRLLDDSWVMQLTHRQQLDAPPPPGVFVEVTTRTQLHDLYGQLVCTHLDPPADTLDADGSLPAGASDGRRRLVVDFDAVPDGFGIPADKRPAFERACRAQVWLSADGHLEATAGDDGSDDVVRFARWLTDPARRELAAGLPSSADRLAGLLDELVAKLSVYESTFVTSGGWLWTRQALAARLDEPVGTGRLWHELDLVADRAVVLYPDPASGRRPAARRALASELALTARGWGEDDRARLVAGVGWVGTLFALSQLIATDLPGTGPSLVETADGLVHAREDVRFGIAGVWQLDPVDDEQAEALREAARDELDREVRTTAEEEVALETVPFSLVVSEQAFAEGVLVLPPDALEALHPRDEVVVRLAFVPAGRHAATPVVAAAHQRPDAAGAVVFDWPALVAPGTRLEGLVSRRGRLVELRPAG